MARSTHISPSVAGATLVKLPYAQESRQQHPVTLIKPQALGLIRLTVSQCQVRNKEAVPQPRATA